MQISINFIAEVIVILSQSSVVILELFYFLTRIVTQKARVFLFLESEVLFVI